MKFAKELEEEAVGKKKIKAISKALRNLQRTPGTEPRSANLDAFSGPRTPFTHYDFNLHRPPTARSTQSLPEIEEIGPDEDEDEELGDRPRMPQRQSHTMFAASPPIYIPRAPVDSAETPPENTPLHPSQPARRVMSYGSIVGTPPDETPGMMAALELPDPALTPARSRPPTELESKSQETSLRLPPPAQVPPAPDPYHVGPTHHPPLARHSIAGSLAKAMFKRRQEVKSQSVSGPLQRTNSLSASQRFRKMFAPRDLTEATVNDMQLSAYQELDEKQADFFAYLDKELTKIEDFYKAKEDEATERLQVLRAQLHEMRDRRIAEIMRAKHLNGGTQPSHLDDIRKQPPDVLKENTRPNGSGSHFIPKPIGDVMGRRSTIGKTSQAMAQMSSPPGPQAQKRINEAKKDYVRREHGSEIKYSVAKKRLKLALQEFYRGLELLKSYALLNKTGFRKINKKYDKAVQARPPLRYMTEKVNNAYFVTSDVVDNHLMAIEDLYARYFERGNHKVAVKKLRSKIGSGDQSAVTFRNGLYVAAGSCFGVAGLVDAAFRLDDPRMSVQTSYLLQLYAGYFLIVILFLMFVLDCRMWNRNHINYVFIFEYDTRHVLDWRQLAELPCFFLFLNGLFIYLNFRHSSYDWFYVYWPLILIVLTMLIIFLPFPILYHNARKWWAVTNMRLACAPFYPVEFRDFYLGDMYCSETYAMGQIEVFFCLYVNDWNNPPQCNSNHSRLLGFFAALPAVWRALQCLRRYYDSRNWFPHLANCLKYCGNIAYYATLSIYRIDMNHTTWSIFVTFALVNGVYCSFWDVFMDWSLGDFFVQKYPFLRERLAYKQVWIYYAAIVADVLLRQQWVFYAIFTSDVQHSALMSFFVSLAEVIRRGIWSLFRVENEHCNNVGKFRASRDIPLPYDIPDSRMVSPTQRRQTPTTPRPTEPEEHIATGVDLESVPSLDASLRQRRSPGMPRTPAMRALQRMGTIIGTAHAQDFERRRKPDDENNEADDEGDGGRSSDEEDDEAEASGGEEEMAELERQRAQQATELAEANRLAENGLRRTR
ncbi:putative signal transduction protein Syg1 [Fonsecaea pedrosoi]|nr:putative signal transduction protein Syg1 [Fonsecaea pedrosoi]